MSKTFPIRALETSVEQFWIRNYSRPSFITAQRSVGGTSFFRGLGEIALLRSRTGFPGLAGPGCYLLALGKCSQGQRAHRSLGTKCTELAWVNQQFLPVGL